MFKLLRWWLCLRFDCICGDNCKFYNACCAFCDHYIYSKCNFCAYQSDCDKKRVGRYSKSRSEAIAIMKGGMKNETK